MAQRVAIVTGAASGVGRAVARRLADQGWQVAALARRPEALAETARSAPEGSRQRIHAFPCDVADAVAVAGVVAEVVQRFGSVHALVNSAGTNVPRRSLEQLSVADFKHLIDVNLTGAFLLVHTFLPGMRRRGRGTIVNVISDAGLFANLVSGAAYTSSKFGMVGLTETINVEERKNGIRACAIFPGEINTPLLEKRPSPPSPEAREKMLQPEDVAAAVIFAIEIPHRATVEKLVLRPRTR